MSDNKFKKDVADPDINVKGLNEIFDINSDTGEIINQSTGEIMSPSDATKELKEIKNELKDLEESLPDVDQIILDNIGRANKFLDKIEDQIIEGNLSATMLESAATLINAVTSAATSITGISYNNDVLDIRREEVRLREKKITLDAMKGNTPATVEGDVVINNNTITMTREELLDEMKGNR